MENNEQIQSILINRKILLTYLKEEYEDKLRPISATDIKYQGICSSLKTIEDRAIQSILSGQPWDQDNILLENTIKERDEYLASLGLTSAPKHICPICEDSGYVNGRLCTCIHRELLALNPSNQTKLPNYKYDDATIAMLKGTKQEKSMTTLYKVFAKYASLFPNLQMKNILVMGASGTGKSCALISLINELTKRHFNALFISAFDMHNIFLKYISAPLESKQSILEPLLNADFLAIDDLGTEPIFKNMSLEYLYLLLENRINNGLATAVCTNLTLDALIDRYKERIYSRITNKRTTYIMQIDECDDLRSRK